MNPLKNVLRRVDGGDFGPPGTKCSKLSKSNRACLCFSLRRNFGMTIEDPTKRDFGVALFDMLMEQHADKSIRDLCCAFASVAVTAEADCVCGDSQELIEAPNMAKFRSFLGLHGLALSVEFNVNPRKAGRGKRYTVSLKAAKSHGGPVMLNGPKTRPHAPVATGETYMDAVRSLTRKLAGKNLCVGTAADNRIKTHKVIEVPKSLYRRLPSVN